MNQYYGIQKMLKAFGEEVYLVDGDWTSTPFGAVVQQTWRNNKTHFEKTTTELGLVGKDYYIYIGPYDHNINSVSDDGYLICGDFKFKFKQKETVTVGTKVQFYYGVLRRIWEDENDLFG